MGIDIGIGCGANPRTANSPPPPLEQNILYLPLSVVPRTAHYLLLLRNSLQGQLPLPLLGLPSIIQIVGLASFSKVLRHLGRGDVGAPLEYLLAVMRLGPGASIDGRKLDLLDCADVFVAEDGDGNGEDLFVFSNVGAPPTPNRSNRSGCEIGRRAAYTADNACCCGCQGRGRLGLVTDAV